MLNTKNISHFLYALVLSFLHYRKYPSEKHPKISGLHSADVLRRDAYGVPHIKTRSEDGLFLLFGYAQAQDRLFQMDMTRLAAEGRLSEIFGKHTLDMDLFVRTMDIENAAQETFSALPSEVKNVMNRFVEGINIYISTIKSHPPFEYILLGLKPEPWKAEDCILLYKFMGLQLLDIGGASFGKLEFYLFSKIFGLETVDELKILERPLNLPSIESHTSPTPTFIRKNVVPQLDTKAVMAIISWLDAAKGFLRKRSVCSGSNAWAIGGNLSTHGQPLLACDPHLPLTVPPILYEAHLELEGQFNSRGVIFPGTPFLMEGCNEWIAWGATYLSGADIADFYYYQFDDSGENYKYKDQWEPLRERKIIIEVREGGETEEHIFYLKYTRHGPVIERSGLKLAIRWPGQEATLETIGGYKMLFARNIEDFQAALRYHDIPPLNFICVDSDGNIGYWVGGKIPLRPAASLFPLNGTEGEGEWIGFIPFDDLPRMVNPPSHFVATANNRPVGTSYPHYMGWNWWDRYRFERITELISEISNIDIDYFKKMQRDNLSGDARIFTPFITAAAKRDKSESNTIKKAVGYLTSWDYRMDKKEVAPTIYDECLQCLLRRVWDERYEEAGLDVLVGKYPPLEVTEYIIKENLTSWLRAERDEVVLTCLKKAVENLRLKMGEDMDRWIWGYRNKCHVCHRFGKYVTILNYPSISVDGGRHTISPVHKFGHRMDDAGSAWRQIIDLANLHNSLSVLAGGQSGHRFHKNWQDQFKLWANFGYKPMKLEF